MKYYCLFGLYMASHFLSGVSMAQYRVTDELFGEYLNAVMETSVAHNNGNAVEANRFQPVANRARDNYEGHISYDNQRGDYYTDKMLTHYIAEGRRFRNSESSYDCQTNTNLNCAERFTVRQQHVRSCHVCNGFTRRFFRTSLFRIEPFYPRYAYFGRNRLLAWRDQIIWRRQYRPIRYDYFNNHWFFGFLNRRYPLTW